MFKSLCFKQKRAPNHIKKMIFFLLLKTILLNHCMGVKDAGYRMKFSSSSATSFTIDKASNWRFREGNSMIYTEQIRFSSKWLNLLAHVLLFNVAVKINVFLESIATLEALLHRLNVNTGSKDSKKTTCL